MQLYAHYGTGAFKKRNGVRHDLSLLPLWSGRSAPRLARLRTIKAFSLTLYSHTVSDLLFLTSHWAHCSFWYPECHLEQQMDNDYLPFVQFIMYLPREFFPSPQEATCSVQKVFHHLLSDGSLLGLPPCDGGFAQPHFVSFEVFCT